MLEFTLCSMVTILPDFLIRRFLQGKRIGKEITLYSMWYELRYGLTLCAILTLSLVTTIFYYHPSTTYVGSFFRTVTILPEAGGRVMEVYVDDADRVSAGDPLFRVDDSVQQAAVDVARSRVDEVNASFVQTESELAAAQGALDQADGALEQARDELETRLELQARNSAVVSERDVERLQNLVAEREGAVSAALSNREAVESRLTTLLPTQRRTAIAELERAQAELAKTIVYAGADGEIQQFVLQEGDFVSALLRPAGILLPDEFAGLQIQAGFNQISAQVLKPGMVAEVACNSKPFDIIPMVVVEVQRFIAAGQFRPSDQLLDVQDRNRPGTLTVELEPMFEGDLDYIPPGSKCVANAYTSNHDRLHSGEPLSTGQYAFLHVIDTVGMVHAMLLRIQAFLLPVQTLVLTGHH